MDNKQQITKAIKSIRVISDAIRNLGKAMEYSLSQFNRFGKLMDVIEKEKGT